MTKLSLFAVAFFAVSAGAHEGHDHPAAAKGSAELERMAALAGTWKGHMLDKDGKPGEAVVVAYKVTGGGSAIVETLGPGTEHEMISVYYDAGGKLGMTHYCMLRNRPELKLKNAALTSLELEAPAAKEEHMHSLRIDFKGPDRIVETWSSMKGGKVGAEKTILDLKKEL